MTTSTNDTPASSAWNAVYSMALCVVMLIAAEFLPVSLLTPIARDLHATEGMTGQAISISGLFAVAASLAIAAASGRFNRRHVLLLLTALLLLSVLLVGLAPSFTVFMIGRAFLGLAIGGFWSLATATVMSLVPDDVIPRAISVVFSGVAVANAFAAPLGSYMGAFVGWRGVFLALAPIVVITHVWQWIALPSMAARGSVPVRTVFGLLRRRHVAVGMFLVLLNFTGAFSTFTYLRPFLETVTGVSPTQLSFALLVLGASGFAGTYATGRLLGGYLYQTLRLIFVLMGLVVLGLLIDGRSLWFVAPLLALWGALSTAMSVGWSTWVTQAVRDHPESAGGLLVACIHPIRDHGRGEPWRYPVRHHRANRYAPRQCDVADRRRLACRKWDEDQTGLQIGPRGRTGRCRPGRDIGNRSGLSVGVDGPLRMAG